MKSSLKIFKLWGIDVKLHYSWWFIFALLAYSLSTGFFPLYYPGLTTLFYWSLGLIASLLLFVSVLLHEMMHSLVAKGRKMKVESITLFFFGGVASLPTEEMKPWTELLMAAAGPVFSLLLAGAFYLLYLSDSHLFLTALAFYLYQLNLVLAIFNLLPGYPLDGGRVFRALLMFYFKDIRKATSIAAKGGKFIGAVLAFFGLLGIFSGLWNSLWFIFLGGFLWFIAGLSYEQVMIKEILSKVSLASLVKKDYASFAPADTLEKIIEHYKKTGEDNLIIKKGQKFFGLVDLRRLSKLGQTEWKKVLVSSTMVPENKIEALNSQDNAFTALRKMTEQKFKLLPLLRK